MPLDELYALYYGKPEEPDSDTDKLLPSSSVGILLSYPVPSLPSNTNLNRRGPTSSHTPFIGAEFLAYLFPTLYINCMLNQILILPC